MNNKKYAILICGQPRVLNRTFIDFCDKININYDIYIHYWISKDDYFCGNLFNRHFIKKDDSIHQKIIDVYKPKKIISEEQKTFDNIKLNIIETNDYQATISQFYSIEKAFELIDNIDEYDYIIKIRFDLQCNNLNCNYFDNLDKENIYFPSHDFIWVVPNSKLFILKTYSYLLNNNDNLNTIPEYIIEQHMKKYNLKCVFSGYLNIIIDRTYIKKGILIFHNGYTDIFNCLGLINYYCEKYNYIFLIIREEIRNFIEYYCKDLKNIKVIYISFDLHLNLYHSKYDKIIEIDQLKYLNCQSNINDLDKLYIGNFDKFRNDNYKNKNTNSSLMWLVKFYECYNIPFSYRYEYFNLQRDYVEEQNQYNNFILKHTDNYILYHDNNHSYYGNICESKKCKLTKKMQSYKNSINLNNSTNKFYDYIMILLNSQEIHVIDSVWACFCYLIDKKYKLFTDKNISIYLYHRFDNFDTIPACIDLDDINNLPPNWKIGKY